MYRLCILSFCTCLFSLTSLAQTSGGSYWDWTDTTLVPNSTPIKAAHINELRARVNQNLLTCGLPARTWTDDPVIPRVTPIKQVHINEIRNAVSLFVQTKSQRQQTPSRSVQFTDPNIVSGSTVIKAVHLNELRTIASEPGCGPMGCPVGQSFDWLSIANFPGSPHPHNTARCNNAGGAQVTSACDASSVGQIVQCCDSNISVAAGTGADCIQYRCGCGPAGPPLPPATCTVGNGTLGTNAITGQPCWRTFSRNANGNFCEEENPFCPTCQPSVVYPTQAACNVAENGNCQAVAGGWSCIP